MAAFACTDFTIQAADGAWINGRSMEFAVETKTTITVHPPKEQCTSHTPEGKNGMQWTSKYGYLSLTIFGINTAVDGFNETGLSFGALWLPGTEYQRVPLAEARAVLDYVDVGAWILGSFSTIDEVKMALEGVRVWGHPIPPLTTTAPLHFTIHDAQGNNLVIEFIKGEMKVYDNPNGVLTNFPTFDWQTTNLQNYINLTALNAGSIDLKGTILGQTGQGSGLLGIPGDWTPPSRFVRITTFIRFAKAAPTALDGVNLAEHLLNTVDIPLGGIQEDPIDSKRCDYTQWVVIKDLTNKILYFRSYKDLSLKSIDLKKLNLTPGAPVKALPIDQKRGYVDLTVNL